MTDSGVKIASMRSKRLLTERRTPIPEKITVVGENTYEIGINVEGLDMLTHESNNTPKRRGERVEDVDGRV